MRLVLVRHGQSTWNAEGLLQGQADPPLSDAGRREAEALAPVLGDFPADHVVSSDLERARETASLAGHPDVPTDPRLREVGVGEWAGRPLAELPLGSEPSWRGGPLVPPGGETWGQMCARVGRAIDDLRARGGSWMVVCHGGVVRAATAHLIGADGMRLGGPPNASVTIVDLAQPPRLLAYGWTPDGAIRGML